MTSIIRGVLMVPAVASGLWLTSATIAKGREPGPSAQSVEMVSESLVAQTQIDRDHEAHVSHAGNLGVVDGRKARIAQLLETLDQVAGVTEQMTPERAAAIEPVLVDLAQRTLDLSDDEPLAKAATDTKLNKLEATVDRLVQTMNQIVEPEMSL